MAANTILAMFVGSAKLDSVHYTIWKGKVKPTLVGIDLLDNAIKPMVFGMVVQVMMVAWLDSECLASGKSFLFVN